MNEYSGLTHGQPGPYHRHMQWIGTKRVAFVPVFRPSFDPPGSPPPDWPQLIQSRVYFQPDSMRGVDVSLRNYIYATSYGRADIEGEVLDMVTVGLNDVPVGFLEPQLGQTLRNQGFDAAAMVMLGGVGSGTSIPLGFWARFVMAEGVGVWAMELTHVITGYMDLYTNDRANDLNTFDNMDCSCGTHPTAYTKVQLGWLDPSTIAVDSAPTAQYNLHAVGLVQPPPPGRYTAVQIETSGNPLFVEARLMVDQFEGGNQWSQGINSQGVIVYELAGVENPQAPPGEIDPLIRLWTQQALGAGQSFTSASGVTVQVGAALAGGFTVSIDNPNAPTVIVPDVTGTPAKLAVKEVEDAGLVPQFSGTNKKGAWVSSQSPVAGTLVARGTTVTMVLKTGPIE